MPKDDLGCTSIVGALYPADSHRLHKTALSEVSGACCKPDKCFANGVGDRIESKCDRSISVKHDCTLGTILSSAVHSRRNVVEIEAQEPLQASVVAIAAQSVTRVDLLGSHPPKAR